MGHIGLTCGATRCMLEYAQHVVISPTVRISPPGWPTGVSPWARRAFPVCRRMVGGLSPRWYVRVRVHGVVWCKYHLKEFQVVVVYVILNKINSCELIFTTAPVPSRECEASNLLIGIVPGGGTPSVVDQWALFLQRTSLRELSFT